MAKPQHPKFVPVEPAAAESVEVTLMRKVAPERFEVVTGTIKGTLSNIKVLERNVSLPVGRLTATKAMRKQHNAVVAKLGIAVES